MEYIWNFIYGAPEEEEKPAHGGMTQVYTKTKDGFEVVKERDIFEQPYTSSSSSEESSDDSSDDEGEEEEEEWFEVNQEHVDKCEAEEEKKRLEENSTQTKSVQSASPPEEMWEAACIIS